MPCALCLEHVELCRSHIIPEFLYTTLYDEKHRLHVLSTAPELQNWCEQKGLRERLLCFSCEQRISVWEGYANSVLFEKVPLRYRREKDLVFISGLNYEKFKLFQLSVLWRAGVSTLQFFENVQLGTHAEPLRQLLLAGNPGSPDRYGCVMIGIRANDQPFVDVIMQPGKVRINGHVAYRFVFGGVLWAMLVSSHSVEPPLNQCVLSTTGETVMLLKDARSMKNLVTFATELGRMGRQP